MAIIDSFSVYGQEPRGVKLEALAAGPFGRLSSSLNSATSSLQDLRQTIRSPHDCFCKMGQEERSVLSGVLMKSGDDCKEFAWGLRV